MEKTDELPADTQKRLKKQQGYNPCPHCHGLGYVNETNQVPYPGGWVTEHFTVACPYCENDISTLPAPSIGGAYLINELAGRCVEAQPAGA